MNSPEAKEKAHLTKLRNHTYNKSKPEEQCYILLSKIFRNIKRQYKSDKYPFTCDFYVQDYDLYIEYNGHWTHGNHIYDEHDVNDIKRLDFMKSKNTNFYNTAIKVWTISDPLKRKIAKDNNLNYIEFWNIREVEAYVNNFTK